MARATPRRPVAALQAQRQSAVQAILREQTLRKALEELNPEADTLFADEDALLHHLIAAAQAELERRQAEGL